MRYAEYWRGYGSARYTHSATNIIIIILQTDARYSLFNFISFPVFILAAATLRVYVLLLPLPTHNLLLFHTSSFDSVCMAI